MSLEFDGLINLNKMWKRHPTRSIDSTVSVTFNSTRRGGDDNRVNYDIAGAHLARPEGTTGLAAYENLRFIYAEALRSSESSSP
ncbi:hypothetical protein JB92DRAFT_3001746 [Gautieria morchelliformis]|nr:hypothetical protein JB92DRAFT_3001746 [Gautieria morchelliformis]